MINFIAKNYFYPGAWKVALTIILVWAIVGVIVKTGNWIFG